MKPGPNIRPSIAISNTMSSPSTTKFHGFKGKHFETLNLLSLIHSEAENLSKGEEVSLMDMRVLDMVAQNSELTRQDLANALCPQREHVVYYSVDRLHKAALIEQWIPPRRVRVSKLGRIGCYFRLTESGEKHIGRIITCLEEEFGALFRSERAAQLAEALARGDAQ